MQGLEENSWSLKEYQAKILEKRAEDKYSQEAWDDLERSLVANLADDIDITINKKHIKMVVTKDFSETLSYISRYALAATLRLTAMR